VKVLRRTIDVLDASRMTATSQRETSLRVSQYFGDAGPFSYQKVRQLTAVLLEGTMPYAVAVAGIEKIQFDLARRCNLDVAKLISECEKFRGRTFYKLQRLSYPVDQDFSISVRPETVAVVDGVANLIFLQPRKNATPWSYNAGFMRRIIEDIYGDYFDNFRIWLVDTEALQDGARELGVVDLQTIPVMSDREFSMRIASLRAAWRLYLREPKSKKKKLDRPNDGQTDFDFGEE
jgi:hypothetical protein